MRHMSGGLCWSVILLVDAEERVPLKHNLNGFLNLHTGVMKTSACDRQLNIVQGPHWPHRSINYVIDQLIKVEGVRIRCWCCVRFSRMDEPY